MGPIHRLQYLKSFRKELRKHSTSAEAYLWSYLNKTQLEGRKFRRQHSIDHFIVDFFCYEEMLAIELDGNHHRYSIEEDQARDAFMAQAGITVLRFENKYVFDNTDWVLDEIRKHFKVR